MAWVVDKGLIKLRDQVDALAPNRSKASDGTIGDAAHAARDSDHNPQDTADADAPGNPDDQVDALDLTHDPAHGADMGAITEAIRASRDPRVSYVIFNRRIFSGPDGPLPYVWRAYTGSDPHTNHAHVSVRDATHDQAYAWQIGETVDDKEWLRLHRVDNAVPAPANWPNPDNPGLAVATALAETLRLLLDMRKTLATIADALKSVPGADPAKLADAVADELAGRLAE